jgi:transposase
MQLYAGLDVHSQFTVGTVKDDAGNIVWQLKVPTNEQGFEKLLGKFAKHELHTVFEASRGWTYVAPLIRKHSKHVVMAHPLRIRAIADARIKTDTIDSNTLSDLLRANLIPESYMPNEDIIRLRNIVRYRVHLGRLSSKMKNKIRNVLAREGKKCEWTDPTCGRARMWLNKVELSSENRLELDYFVKLLDDVKQEIAKQKKVIETEALKYPDVELLRSIPGIDTYSGLLILSEIADINRFPTPEKLAAYSGLISSTYQSGNSCYQGRITKQGSRWMRWILVECALLAIRKPNRLQRFYKRLAFKKGHQKAIVATARKLITIIWHLLAKKQAFVSE